MRGKAAAPRRDRAARRRAVYAYRLADLDELFTDAEARADAEVEMRRDAANRRSNVRFVGIMVVVAVGLGVVAAGVIHQVYSIIATLFSAT
ncbi:MAG TPA: hypothetical protein VFR11_13925 [Micromonosporaceae bacterium]|nr:hypothetical protein [Micromonosporaceae bacterium]